MVCLSVTLVQVMFMCRLLVRLLYTCAVVCDSQSSAHCHA